MLKYNILRHRYQNLTLCSEFTEAQAMLLLGGGDGGGEGHAVDAQADVGVDPRSGLAGAPLTAGLHTRAGVVVDTSTVVVVGL